jgi:hypothetical protein
VVVPIDETTSHFSGSLLLPYALPTNYSLALCSVPNDNCGIRARGGHEDAKHRDDDAGTTQLRRKSVYHISWRLQCSLS